MFHTFTGSSRRPRQVNLSGRNNNPFAQTTSSQTPHNAVAQAQQERKLRQLERDKLQAAKILQKSWRGYAKRKEVKDDFRRAWDEQEFVLDTASMETNGVPAHPNAVLEQLRLLVRFASPSDDDDVERVQQFTKRLYRLAGNFRARQFESDWTHALARLAKIILAMIQRIAPDLSEPFDMSMDLIHIVVFLVDLIPDELTYDYRTYYNTLAQIIELIPSRLPQDLRADGYTLLQSAITSLLRCPSVNDRALAYCGFASEILSVPNLCTNLRLEDIAVRIDTKQLASSLEVLILPEAENSLTKRKNHQQLQWILAHFIFLHGLAVSHGQSAKTLDAVYIFVVSSLLSELANEIRSTSDMAQTSSPRSIPPFVLEQISTLVNKASISSLLLHADLVPSSIGAEQETSSETAALASFALILLRIFPRRADEICMWIYLGSAPSRQSSNSTERIPALKYFWESVARTSIFHSISNQPRNAIEFLNAGKRSGATGSQHQGLQKSELDQEWRILLLFLELYTFVLKVMDDEEFMTGADSTSTQQSWTRQSALKLGQVKDLTVFLKNLAFAMYWHSDQLREPEKQEPSKSLANYFGNARMGSPEGITVRNSNKSDDGLIAGMSGTSQSYLKDMVTGLLRMLYERDSRRGFLPKDHWLMLAHFDMEGFIPHVVEEEASRNRLLETGEVDDDLVDTESEEDESEQDILVGTFRAQQVARFERRKQNQQKAAKKKQYEAVAPRLKILQNMPFFIPFATRVQIFREFVMLDQARRRNGYIDADQWRLSLLADNRGRNIEEIFSKHHAKVRRDHVFDDAFEQFKDLGVGLKEPIQITFIDQFDTVEAGIDGGGVTKEFLTSITKEAFTPTSEYQLFAENDQHLLFPNPSTVDARKHHLRQFAYEEGCFEWNDSIRELLSQYEFLGRIIGKCLYEGILVDIQFAPFFLVKWALTGGSGSATNESGYRANINDLKDLDEGLYQGLVGDIFSVFDVSRKLTMVSSYN